MQIDPNAINLGPLEPQLVASAVVVFVLQWVKKSKLFPWITTETAKLNRIVAVVMSGLAALGVHATFDNGTLMITGLTVTGILTGILTWFKSYVVQQMTFKVLVTSPAPAITAVPQPEKASAAVVGS